MRKSMILSALAVVLISFFQQIFTNIPPLPDAEASKKAEVKQSKQTEVEKPKKKIIKKWAVKTSPKYGVSAERINIVLAHFQKRKMTKKASAYLVGNFLAESGLEPCAGVKGDGGLAWGLGQWHPDRRYDMPCGLIAQLDWAIDVEMPRDAQNNGYTSLKTRLYSKKETREGLLLGFSQWERYGLEGGRATFGDAVYSQLK